MNLFTSISSLSLSLAHTITRRFFFKFLLFYCVNVRCHFFFVLLLPASNLFCCCCCCFSSHAQQSLLRYVSTYVHYRSCLQHTPIVTCMFFLQCCCYFICLFFFISSRILIFVLFHHNAII